MRVGIVAACPFLADRGTPLRIYGLARGLAKSGHEVTVVTYHLGRELPNDCINVERIPRIPFYEKLDAGPSPMKPLVDLILLFRVYQLFQQETVDVLIGSHIEGALISSLLKKVLRVPVLFDAHGSFAGEMAAFGYPTEFFPLQALCRTIENFVLASVDGVGTVSRHLRDHFSSRCDHPEYEVIPNGIDPEDYEETQDIREEFCLPEDEWLITYTGNLQEYQGIQYLLEAAYDLTRPDVHFLIVGGPGEERYRSIAENKNLKQYVTFTGRIQAERIPDILASSDILVSPRIGRETEHQQASKLIQYMAAGKAIVATDIPPHAILRNEENGLLIKDESGTALGNAISRLIENDELRSKLGRNAKETSKNYHWDSISDRFLDLLE